VAHGGRPSSRSTRRSCVRVAAEQQRGGVTVPPAWDRRVVVPEVQPRNTPKVCACWDWRVGGLHVGRCERTVCG
jgi:hypothetical protein